MNNEREIVKNIIGRVANSNGGWARLTTIGTLLIAEGINYRDIGNGKLKSYLDSFSDMLDFHVNTATATPDYYVKLKDSYANQIPSAPLFKELAYVPHRMESEFDSLISYLNISRSPLIYHFGSILREHPEYWHEDGTSATFNTGYRDQNGHRIIAHFTPNWISNAQKWYLSKFSAEGESEPQINNASRQTEPRPAAPLRENLLPIDPILANFIKKYKESHALDNFSDGIVFGRFVNQTILENFAPDSIVNDEALLDSIDVDGTNDTGIDGLCIFVNDKIPRSPKHIQEIIKVDHYIRSVEIVFIQSKFKDRLSTEEVAKFILGIEHFFQNELYRNSNEKISNWFEIKQEILSGENASYLQCNHISVRAYYVNRASVPETAEIRGHLKTLEGTLKELDGGLYEVKELRILGVDEIKNLARNESKFLECTITVADHHLSLLNNANVSGRAVRINATELLNLLVDKTTGLLRKGMFDENVRDYQGETPVNFSIRETIEKAPENFILCNNGITILASEFRETKGGATDSVSYTIRNPQIVNGCQTCNVIYYASKDQKLARQLEKVELFAKIIVTESDDLITSIVSANNNQNAVTDMVMEISKQYHKRLEEYFNAYQDSTPKKHIFYERRSKSLERENLMTYQRCTLRNLIQSTVAVWFGAPHDSAHSESFLLDKYRNRVFSDNHDEFCYYASASLFANFDRLISKGIISNKYRKYKAQICFIIREEMENADSVELNDTANAHLLAEEIMRTINDDEMLIEKLKSAISKFDSTKANWISQKGENYIYGITDSSEFTEFLRNNISPERFDRTPSHSVPSSLPTSEIFSGSVISVGNDRNGTPFCRIRNSDFTTVWAIQDYSATRFSSLRTGQSVVYKIQSNDRTGQQMAVQVMPSFSSNESVQYVQPTAQQIHDAIAAVRFYTPERVQTNGFILVNEVGVQLKQITGGKPGPNKKLKDYIMDYPNDFQLINAGLPTISVKDKKYN